MVKKILIDLAMIGAGIFMWIKADEFVFMLFSIIPIDFRIIGSIIILIAIIDFIVALKERTGGKGKTKAPKAAKPAPQTASQSRPAAATAQSRPAPAQPRPAAATAQPRPVAAPPRQGTTSQEAAEKVRQHAEKSAEQCRANLEALENHFNNSRNNPELLLPSLMAAYDSFLRSRGSYTFSNYQYRFYAALRAIHKEEQYGVAPSTRRFWVVHSAVHGGIAAGKAKDLAQLEAALEMLERAQDFRPEGNRPVDDQYVQMALPAVRCWDAYLVARLSLERGDYQRATSALWTANQLFPHQGSLRLCHLNPHLQDQTQVILTRQQLEALHNQLSTMNRY